MGNHRVFVVAGIAGAYALLALGVRAAGLPGSMSEQALIETPAMPRISMGATMELLRRDVRIDARQDSELKGMAWSGYLGVDARPWLTLFGTAGMLSLEALPDTGVTEDYDDDLRWSIGFNASLWHIDLRTPDFMRGRLSLGMTAEYADYTAGGTTGDATWTETAVALPLGFEIPNESMEYWGVRSLFLYAGPVFSALEGDLATGGGRRVDLEEDQTTGILGGADLYLAPNVSLGASVVFMDQASVSVAARYHF